MAAARFEMSAAQLSRIETGKSPYTQDFLEMAAESYRTDVASLLKRDPTDEDAIWSIWDQAKPGERQQIEELARVVVRRRA
jgi:transcriptional regulator with XRE-family HTH domain